MSPKPRAPTAQPEKINTGRWRIVVGDREVESYASEEMAKSRYFSLSRSRIGDEGLKLIRPDGKVEWE